ncbi:hypothetical protein ACIQMR_35230 [Streptomyces sp. NPDC091376]|uniref:hypothetical protein n=1 Tax=Streptomyces sp. NPDC091376 TaxID=3365994 RepID=UPI003821C7DA
MPSSKAPARRGRTTPATPASDAPVPVESLPTLDPSEISGETTRQLIARGAAYVREYANVEHQPTIQLRNLAVVLVELRQRHTDSEGRPDLLGRSQAYRNDAAEVYSVAGVAPDSQARTQTNVRWHVGNLLREVFDGDTMREYKLKTTSPVERLQDAREQRAAIVAAARAEETVGTAQVPTVRATADHIRLGSAVASIVGQMSVEVISSEMTDGQRAKLDAQLAEVQQLVAKLRRHTRKRSSDA